jgi:hypothetical protein
VSLFSGERRGRPNGDTSANVLRIPELSVDPQPPIKRGLSDLVPLSERYDAIRDALGSFGSSRPYSSELRKAMSAALRESMALPPEATDALLQTPALGEVPSDPSI